MTSTQKLRLKIAVLNRNFSPKAGGAERYSIALVEQLAAHHDIHVFAQLIEHQFPAVSYHPVPQFCQRPRWLNQLWYALYTWRQTRRGFDIVHSHENTWHGNIQTVHVRPIKVGLFHGRSGWRRWQRYLQILTSPRLLIYLGLERARFARRPDRLIIPTALPVQQELETAYPRLTGHTRIVPPGVTPPENDGDQQSARTMLGLDPEATWLLLVGNDYEKKGLGTLLQALAQLPPIIRLAVVGNAKHIPRFQQQAEALGIDDRVRFLGQLADPTPAYLAANILVHPTREDTFAMVVLEALANGLPTIVSGPAWCGIAAELKDEETALLLASPFDPKHLAHSIMKLVDNPELSQKLASAGRTFAASFSWHEVAKSYEKHYFEISPPTPDALIT